MLFLVFYSAS
jgi:replication factor A2